MGKSTGKPSAPVDTMSVMRKLEPIYELIDAGNNKGALQAIDRDLLRKYPALQIGRVLKGIVLGRLGRFDEGRELCESVRAEGPSDDTVLNTLALYYRQNDMRAELIGAFESASERQPRNVEYLKTLFSAYARDYVHVKQQQCAMKLYRLTNDPKHITWAVCAMLVQSRDVPSLIRVAAAACAKLRDAGAVRDRETLLVCARVFREAGDIDASLALLDGPIGDACLPMLAERASLRAATASLAGYKDVAAARWREVLAVAPDDWAAMRAAMDIAVPGTRAGNGGTAPPPPGGSWPSPGAHSVDGAGEVGRLGRTARLATPQPPQPRQPRRRPSQPTSRPVARWRASFARRRTRREARASPVVDRTCSPSRRRGARSRRRRTNAPPGEPRGRPRSRPVRAPTHRNWNRTRRSRAPRSRIGASSARGPAARVIFDRTSRRFAVAISAPREASRDDSPRRLTRRGRMAGTTRTRRMTRIVVARRPFDGFDARWRRRPFARTSARSADRGATFRVRERHRRVCRGPPPRPPSARRRRRI